MREEALYLADQIRLLTQRPTRVAESLNYEDARPLTMATWPQPGFVSTQKRSLKVCSAKCAAAPGGVAKQGLARRYFPL